MTGIFDWYRKPVEERAEIVYRAEMEKTINSIMNYYRGLGELQRSMTRIRGDDQ
jgi:hypothetical protein